MSTHRVQIVVLCEGLQDATFASRFLKKLGWSARAIRIRRAPPGKGAGEQYVRDQYPQELKLLRQDSVRRALIVMIDGDTDGLDARFAQLNEACKGAGVEVRRPNERVAVLVPTRNIETWFRYLDGHEVDEVSVYPRLLRERDCQRHVDELVRMRGSKLREPAPPSLRAACDEFRAITRSS